MSTRVSEHSYVICCVSLIAIAVARGPALAIGQVSAKSVAGGHAVAERVAGQRQGFEVASIRLVDPHVAADNSAQFAAVRSNRFTMRRADLRLLIQLAYGINTISGGPEWVYSQNYSVSAKVEGDALLTQKEMRPLLQNLLEERFQLKVHREQKIVPGYALVIAKSGARLQATNGGPYFAIGVGGGSSELKVQDDSVEDFAKAIGYSAFEEPVVDRTGLEGMYDFDLKFRPENGSFRDDPRFANLPDIFSAVQVQLGLKLVKEKVPVDSLVIDHVERPSEN